MTRHGPGPFVTEDPTLELADTHNQNNPWQGPFRVGHLDGVALSYAIEAAGGVHAIALNHLDVAARRPDLKICRAYQIEDRVLTRLTPGPPHDLEYQERLTAMLLRPACLRRSRRRLASCHRTRNRRPGSAALLRSDSSRQADEPSIGEHPNDVVGAVSAAAFGLVPGWRDHAWRGYLVTVIGE
jgi:hypothetical protein